MCKKIAASLMAIFVLCSVFLTTAMPVQAAGDTKTRVMITNYTVSEDDVIPGEEFDLTFTVKNTSPVNTAYSVLLTCASDSTSVYPEYGTSNQIYIEEMAPNQEQQVTIRLEAAATLETLSVDYLVDLSYFDEVEGTTSNQSVIQIPIGQESMLVVQNYSVSDTATVGTKSRISVSYENMGIDEISDVVLKIYGTGMDEQDIEIGDVTSGYSDNEEAYFAFNTTGTQTVSFVMTYKDSEGTEYTTDEIQSTVEVGQADAGSGDSTVLVDSTSNGLSLSNWQILLVVVILVMIVIVVILLRKDRK